MTSTDPSVEPKSRRERSNSTGRKTEKQDIQNWHVDAYVENQVKGYLSGIFTFTDVDADRVALMKATHSSLVTRLFGLPNFVRSSTKVDAYVIIRPAFWADGPEGISGRAIIISGIEVRVIISALKLKASFQYFGGDIYN